MQRPPRGMLKLTAYLQLMKGRRGEGPLRDVHSACYFTTGPSRPDHPCVDFVQDLGKAGVHRREPEHETDSPYDLRQRWTADQVADRQNREHHGQEEEGDLQGPVKPRASR